jgi:hypothetical protein
MRIKLFLCLIAFAFLSPTGWGQKSLPAIDVAKALKKEQSLKLSDFAKSIEYVKLETNTDCLINRGTAVLTDDLILVRISREPKILAFDYEGKFLYQIGRHGQGPGEYLALADFAVSPDGKTLAVADFYQMLIFFFKTSGEFIGKVKGVAFMYDGFGFIDNDHLMTYTTQDGGNGGNYRFRIYNTDLSGPQELVWADNAERLPIESPMSVSGQCLISPTGTMFRDRMNDTLFSLNEAGLKTPELIIDLGKMKHPAPLMTREEFSKYRQAIGLAVTSDFYIMNITGEQGQWRTLLFDRKSKNSFSLPLFTDCPFRENSFLGVENDLDGIQPFSILRSSQNNKWVGMLQMVDLKEYLESGCWQNQKLKHPQYRDQLIELVNTSALDDNPIVRIVHLK